MNDDSFGRLMRAATKAARSVLYPESFRPECRVCPPYLGDGATDSLITSFEYDENGNRFLRVKREVAGVGTPYRVR